MNLLIGQKTYENKEKWAYILAESNFNDLKKCDCIFAIVNGTSPDEGVMIEWVSQLL